MINFIKHFIYFFIPRKYKYYILVAKTSDIINLELKIDEIRFLPINKEMLLLYDKSNFLLKFIRNNYLTRGDKGFIALFNDVIIGICWISHNNDVKTKIYNYYPLNPGHCWIHSNWVNPKFRGRGIHKKLILLCINNLLEIYGKEIIFEVNINSKNLISLKNFAKIGFQKIDEIFLWKWLFFTKIIKKKSKK